MNKWLSNKELRRQVTWWTIGIGFFLVPLLYAVIANDFSSKIQAALDAGVKITGFAIIGIFIGSVVVYNFKIQSVDDTRENDDKIDKSFTDLHDRKMSIKQEQIPSAMEYINTANERGQADANDSLAKRTITKQKNKLVVAQIKGKSKRVSKIKRTISNLETNAMYDKKFRGLKYKDVLKNNNGFFNGESTYRKRYIDNPTATNWWFKIITTPLKFLTLGGSLLSGMIIGISWEALFLFYLSVTVMTGIPSLIAYVLISKRVINKTYKANTNMIEYIDDMMKEISTPPSDIIDKEVMEEVTLIEEVA